MIGWTRKHTVVLVGLVAICFAGPYGYAAIYYHDLTVKIVTIDAPITCHPGQSVLHPRPTRSSAPKHNYLGYCGYVRAENGVYVLPSSSEFLSPHAPRARLLEQLTEGCEYRVRIVGMGPPFRASEGFTNRNRHTISHILDVLPC